MYVLWHMVRRAVERHTQWLAPSLRHPQLQCRTLNRASFQKQPMSYSSNILLTAQLKSLHVITRRIPDCLPVLIYVTGWSLRSQRAVIWWRCQWWRSIIMKFWTCWPEMKMGWQLGWRERSSPPVQAPVRCPA